MMARTKQTPPEADPTTEYEQLSAFVRRIESLEADRAVINEDIKEIYAEAKGTGFNTKIIRKVIMKRRRDPKEVHETEELIEVYESGLEKAGSNLTGPRGTFAS